MRLYVKVLDQYVKTVSSLDFSDFILLFLGELNINTISTIIPTKPLNGFIFIVLLYFIIFFMCITK